MNGTHVRKYTPIDLLKWTGAVIVSMFALLFSVAVGGAIVANTIEAWETFSTSCGM
jgi:hypothetical protein